MLFRGNLLFYMTCAMYMETALPPVFTLHFTYAWVTSSPPMTSIQFTADNIKLCISLPELSHKVLMHGSQPRHLAFSVLSILPLPISNVTHQSVYPAPSAPLQRHTVSTTRAYLHKSLPLRTIFTFSWDYLSLLTDLPTPILCPILSTP